MDDRRAARPATGTQPDPVARLADDVAAIGRQEAAVLRDDALVTLSGATSGLAVLLAGGVCAALGVATASTAVLRAVETRLPPRWAAAVLTAGYLGIAAAAGVLGTRRLHAAGGGAQRLVDQFGGELSGLGRRVADQARRAPRFRAER